MTSAIPPLPWEATVKRAVVWLRLDGVWHAADKMRGRKARRACDGRWRRHSDGLPPGLRPAVPGPDVCAACHLTER